MHIFELSNAHGLRVRVMEFGATIVGIETPDRDGHLADIVLGFNDPMAYAKAKLTFGTVGRVIGRIADARFDLDGKTYQLTPNSGLNLLHGGAHGFARRLWKGEIVSSNPPGVRFTRESPDGEEGFPGTVQAAALFTLRDDDRLTVRYSATTTRPTPVNLAGHTRFNLSGEGNGTILHDLLTIRADSYLPLDAKQVPTGEIRSVEGTPLDFRRPTRIDARFADVPNKPPGYDYNFVVNPGPWQLEVHDPASGRVLQVKTTQPGIQFDTGNPFDGTLTGKSGQPYPRYGAFSCETQHYPDSINHPNFPPVVLRPGETYAEETEYHFLTRP